MVIEQMENYDSVLNGAFSPHFRTLLKTRTGEKSNKCNLCEYACSDPSALRTHLKTHSGDKSNKCDQCDFASSYKSALRTHLKTHSIEKSNKCDQCDYASYDASYLKKTFEDTRRRKVKLMQQM